MIYIMWVHIIETPPPGARCPSPVPEPEPKPGFGSQQKGMPFAKCSLLT